jgi:glycyl-tRNA synthetase
MGYKYDVVDAVLAEQSANPAAAAQAVKQLQAWVEREDWPSILPAFARCVRITRSQQDQFKVKEKVFAESEENNLFAALQKAESASRREGSVDDFLQAFVPMIPSVNAFFDKVLVMAEDKKLQENRLALLQRIAALSKGVADLSKLEGF